MLAGGFDEAVVFHFFDISFGVAQFRQDFRGILAGEGRHAADFRLGIGHLERNTNLFDFTQCWMVKFDDHLAGDNLGVFKELIDFIDRGNAGIGFHQDRHPLGTGFAQEDAG